MNAEMNRRSFIAALAAAPLALKMGGTAGGNRVMSVEEMTVMRDSAERMANIFALPIPSVLP